MASKKSAAQEAPEIVETEVIEEEIEQVKGPGPLDEPNPQMLAMQAEIERLKKENEQLKINSVYSSSPTGGMTDSERVHQACEQAAKDGKDPWDVKISVQAQRIGKGEDSYWLCVNGHSMQVPANDRYYDLALPLAQCLVDEIRSRYRAEDYKDSIQVYDPKENPHPVERIV